MGDDVFRLLKIRVSQGTKDSVHHHQWRNFGISYDKIGELFCALRNPRATQIVIHPLMLVILPLLTSSQVWLSPLVQDGQPTYFTNLKFWNWFFGLGRQRSQYIQTDPKVLNVTAIIATTTMDDAQKVVPPQKQGCEGNEFSEVASTSGPSSKLPTCQQVSDEMRAFSISLTTEDRLRIGLSADELQLKTEFDTIKKRFDSLPQVLQEIPHMNPCGIMCLQTNPHLEIRILNLQMWFFLWFALIIGLRKEPQNFYDDDDDDDDG